MPISIGAYCLSMLFWPGASITAILFYWWAFWCICDSAQHVSIPSYIHKYPFTASSSYTEKNDSSIFYKGISSWIYLAPMKKCTAELLSCHYLYYLHPIATVGVIISVNTVSNVLQHSCFLYDMYVMYIYRGDWHFVRNSERSGVHKFAVIRSGISLCMHPDHILGICLSC